MGLLKSIKKIGTNAVKVTKKIGKSVSSAANSAVKGTEKAVSTVVKKTGKALQSTIKPTGIFNTTVGKILTKTGKLTGTQAITDAGRLYKSAGRNGKQAAKKHVSKKRVSKNLLKLEKQAGKTLISGAMLFA